MLEKPSQGVVANEPVPGQEKFNSIEGSMLEQDIYTKTLQSIKDLTSVSRQLEMEIDKSNNRNQTITSDEVNRLKEYKRRVLGFYLDLLKAEGHY
ncbi:MAG: hypothetical protein HYT30_01365 [Parcubacteria group bacterium]|nr:hypothetical protein [Parcubacteria group bacterium]